MTIGARLALFAVLLAAVFGGAALLGGAVDPDGADEETTHAATPEPEPGHAGEEPAGAHGGKEEDEGHAASGSSDAAALPGLAAAQDGLRLVLDDTRVAAGRRDVRFRIVDDAGRPVRRFDLAHEKRMHLIVVRRDLRGFQHLHPEMEGDGTWSVRADLSRPGVHRVYADFTIDGEQHTLGTDVHVPGRYEPAAVPAAGDVDRLPGGLEVRLRREGAHVSFSVLRDGRPVDDQLEDYLGAKGHLVTLRAADLAYLHTHPDGDELAFETELPSAGTYRLWVQFQLDGRVHTAAFTQEAQR